MTTPVGEPLGLRGTEQWRRRSRSSPRSSLVLFSFASRMCSPTNCWLWCSCSSTFCSGCMHLTHVPLRFRFAVHWGRLRVRNKWTGRIRRSQMVDELQHEKFPEDQIQIFTSDYSKALCRHGRSEASAVGCTCAVAFSAVVFPPTVSQVFGGKATTLNFARCPDWSP